MAEGADGFQRGLHVEEVRDHVDHEHDVERPVQGPEQRGIPSVAADEADGVAAVEGVRGLHRGRGQVDPDRARGAQGGQQVAGAASDIEDGLPGRDPRLEDARKVAVEVAARMAGALDACVVLLVEAADLVDQRIGTRRGGRGADDRLAVRGHRMAGPVHRLRSARHLVGPLGGPRRPERREGTMRSPAAQAALRRPRRADAAGGGRPRRE